MLHVDITGLFVQNYFNPVYPLTATFSHSPLAQHRKHPVPVGKEIKGIPLPELKISCNNKKYFLGVKQSMKVTCEVCIYLECGDALAESLSTDLHY